MVFAMQLHLEWKAYARPFREPLTTAKGVWRERTGILLRLEASDGRVGFGEICPLEVFGTESLEEAKRVLHILGHSYAGFRPGVAPPDHPATEMGLWLAERMLHEGDPEPERHYAVAGLLPAGEAAVDALRELAEEGFRHFKWKVGVHGVKEELSWLNLLVELLPPRGRLRLDANTGLDREACLLWLDRLKDIPQVEFFEEPTAAGDRDWFYREALSRGIEVALDESVRGVDSLLKALISGWKGLLVIKPAIVGSPHQYVQWQGQWERDFVFSSVFESAIGMEGVLRLIASLPERGRVRALGFGTNRFFPDDGFSLHGTGPEVRSGCVKLKEMEEIWARL